MSIKHNFKSHIIVEVKIYLSILDELSIGDTDQSEEVCVTVAHGFGRLLEHLERAGSRKEDIEIEFVCDQNGQSFGADVGIAGECGALPHEVVSVPTGLHIDILAFERTGTALNEVQTFVVDVGYETNVGSVSQL